MSLDLKILYRGPLSSCNYDCHYCPFAKHFESADELEGDRIALQEFCNWIVARNQSHPNDRFSILMTPWGEGLTRRWYREALIVLSNLANIEKVAIQTNISCRLKWIEQCDLKNLGLWCTWHPTQISREKFVSKCAELDLMQVNYSVGIVGLRDYMAEAELLRSEISQDVYMWVNAYKDVENYYRDGEVEFWKTVDPLFAFNNSRHPSLDRACRAGQSVISIDGDGNMRRCHFIKDPIGNLYSDNFTQALQPRLCTNHTCGCHIGYVHMNELGLYETFGRGVLERVPSLPIWKKATIDV